MPRLLAHGRYLPRRLGEYVNSTLKLTFVFGSDEMMGKC